ncbi:PREDICTED: 39S ribosomal protein L54, mitochondrial [Dufourea novaeangliae]|uniref:39S ribosomal protein L54, mitochondrial n=1 Tax=Dufourea novaeangliae TaxID=178035 RepID=UPI0007670FB7|nr:PREDICTED: 39S ribosomal protein L54, mitochondrial [Dufourea novaeangliae]
MSFLSALRLFQFKETFIIPVQYAIQVKNYAVLPSKKAAKSKQIKIEKVKIPVEKDVNKLLNYVCGSNIYTEGEDIKLKPDNEYPDWIWEIRTEPLQLSELDPDTKQYWRFVRRDNLKRNNAMKKYRRP